MTRLLTFSLAVSGSAVSPRWTREIFGNLSRQAQLLFYLVAAIAVLIFGWGLALRMRRWQGNANSAPWWRSLATSLHAQPVLRDVIGLRRMQGNRPVATAAHRALFTGFLLLLLGTTLIAVEHLLAMMLGRTPQQPVFHYGWYYLAFEWVLDTGGLLFLAGLVPFAWRRWRRSASVDHRASDGWILVGLGVIGASGFAVESLRILATQPEGRWFSYVGASLAAVLPLEPAGVTAIQSHRIVWWLHALAALGGIAVLPWTRMRHSVAGTLRLLQRPTTSVSRPLGDLETLEARGYVGVAALQDLSSSQRMMLDACVACGRCQDACPAHAAGTPLSPKQIVQALWQPMERDTEASRAEVLPGAAIATASLWSCTTCAACVEVCPLGVSPLELILDMRQFLVSDNQLRGSAGQALQQVQRTGNPWGLPSADRMAWADGLHVPTVSQCPDFDVLYWVGCAAAYDRRAGRIARAVVRLLEAAGVRFAVLAQQERCTGDTARRLGDEFLFQELAERNVAQLQKAGVRRIVTHCPHCLTSLKHDYAKWLGQVVVQHHTEFLAELLTLGRLPLAAPPSPQSPPALGSASSQPQIASGQSTPPARRIAFHDPCYLARINGQSEAPRHLLHALATQDGAITVHELPHNRTQTACCGAGGGRMWFDDGATGQRIGQDRIAEIVQANVDAVAVGCPFCKIMVSDGLADQAAPVAVRDLAELLADQLPPPFQESTTS